MEKTRAKSRVKQHNIPACRPSYTAGLDDAAVQLRMRSGLANMQVESPTKSEKQIVKEKCLTFFNLIFVVLAVCLMLVGSFGDILFLGIAIANTAIGIFQEIRSKRTIDRLTLMTARKVPVTRNGQKVMVPSDQLVRDDIVEFAAGDQICADAVVRIGQLQVNESLITGEEDPIMKHPGDELLSGSFVVSGRCKAQLTRVGAESYAARLTLEAKKDVKVGNSEMMAALDKVIRVIGIVMVPLGVALFFKQYRVLELGLQASVKATVAALIGMIPEGLYLLTSVALAVSVLRLAQKRVLTQDMNCIENLARVDVLCVDKTGTITEAVMEAGDPILLDGEECPLADVNRILSAVYGASQPDNDTGRAMAERFSDSVDWEVAKVIPFSSATKWTGVVFREEGSFLAGAPEFIMGARYEEVSAEVQEWTQRGYRVLLLAAYDGIPEPEDLRKESVLPLALIPLTNRIRPEAPETFRYFNRQGVAVKVISGDNPVTVSEVARQAGIPNADLFVDARQLETEEDFSEAAEHYAVFGRVTPDQKRKLIRAMQDAGHTVAMTGDGVNDVLALKDADCSVAMASGSAAARNVAEIVLADNDFAHLPEVVAEGRRSINNLQRSASLFLMKTVYSAVLALVCIVLPPYPFIPVQMSLVSTAIIGTPSFLLALEPNHERVRGRFLKNVLSRSLPASVAIILAIVASIATAKLMGWSDGVMSTVCMFQMFAVGIALIYRISRPLNPMRVGVICVVVAIVVAGTTVGAGFFSVVSPTFNSAVTSVAIAAAAIVLFNRLYDESVAEAGPRGLVGFLIRKLEALDDSE